MNNFLTASFWFNQRTEELIPLFKTSLLLIIVLLVAAAITSLLIKKRGGIYARLWERIFNFSTTNAVIGVLLFFFNHELIPVLSTRFWFLLWLFDIITWIIFIVRYAKSIPDKKKAFEKQREFQKYIPK